MLKKIWIKFWPAIIITIVIFTFHSRLFFPHLSIYTTPDFGRTDIIHISLPEKLIESEMLRGFHFSLWENRAGNGYAVLPEAVLSYIPNVIIFFLFPLNLAVPIWFLSTFLIAAASMYYLLRKLNLEKLSATFGAITFAFSASMIIEIPHITVAQSISIVPLAIALNLGLIRKIDKKTIIFLAIILAQILATFTQTFVYLILLLLFLDAFYIIFEKKKEIIKFALACFVAITLSLLLSAAQIIANYEALKLSQRDNGINPESILSAFPLLPKNLLAYIDPFIVGKASNGTYNSGDWATNGLYWENTAYIGILPFILSIFAILYIIKSKSKNIYFYFITVTLISLALSLGIRAPLHILFSFPPLNFFRVPARFILFTQIFLIILAAFGFDHLLKKVKRVPLLIFSILILVTIINFYSTWWNYHPIESLRSVEEKPQILNSLDLQNTSDYRFYSIGTVKQWNDIFIKSGWDNKEDYYKFFRNSLDPNLSLFYGINHFSSYQVLKSKRQNLLQSQISQYTQVKENSISFDNITTKAFNIYSVKYIVTTLPLDGNFVKLAEVTKDKYKYYLYENAQAKNKFQIYYNYQTINYIGDYIKAFENTDLSKTVLIENNPSFIPNEGENTIKINKQTSTNYDLEVFSSKPGILVLNDSYTNDWKATVDNNPTNIYPANINSKSIIVPQGNHKINIHYRPVKIYIGILVSVVAYLFSIKIILKKD